MKNLRHPPENLRQANPEILSYTATGAIDEQY